MTLRRRGYTFIVGLLKFFLAVEAFPSSMLFVLGSIIGHRTVHRALHKYISRLSYVHILSFCLCSRPRRSRPLSRL